MKIIEFENCSEIHCVKGIKKSQRGDSAGYIINWLQNDLAINEISDKKTQDVEYEIDDKYNGPTDL